jgi:outer membrane protein OmpA-like peptidoglycan-associated protein
MSMAALIPGLAVKVEGTYNNEHQLVAKAISFKGNDLERAKSIQAGLHETQGQAQQNKAELEQQNAELKAQNEALQRQQQQISANKAAVDAAVARFGQLDDYYILDELTVHFGNGKVKVDPKYSPQLLALAGKAKTINGYMIEVKGCEDRAAAVTKYPASAGPRSPHPNAGTWRDGREPPGRQRQDRRRAGGESSRGSACFAEPGQCRHIKPS